MLLRYLCQNLASGKYIWRNLKKKKTRTCKNEKERYGDEPKIFKSFESREEKRAETVLITNMLIKVLLPSGNTLFN